MGTPSCEDVEDILDKLDERPEFPLDSVKDCMSLGCRFSRGACLKITKKIFKKFTMGTFINDTANLGPILSTTDFLP
jgi:hypothetical protein